MDSYLCKMYMYHVWVSLANIVRKQLQVLDMRQKMDIYLLQRRTKEGGIHSWVNGDLDEDDVSFSFNSTPLFGLSAPVLYFVEGGLGDSDSDNDNLTKRLELKINKKMEKKGEKK